MAQADCTVKHYHADNNAFAHKGFLDEVNRKDQKIIFCAIGAHHQNGLIKNKNKMLTLSARTLLLHGICMWLQMIDTMFWPFAFKAAAKQHNLLLLSSNGQTPLSMMHDVPINTIPVKMFHTLFCPMYVLDSCSQSAGSPGPPKWEPRGCIGVYLGHLPFHAGSMALIFNPRTGQVLAQYHVVFDDTFLTVPYMDAGTVPLHWEDLLKHLSKKATGEEFSLAEDWMDAIEMMPDQSNVMAGSRIPDPFAVVTEGNNPANATQAATASQDQPPNAQVPHRPRASKGGNVCTLASSLSASDAAASPAQKR